MRYSPAQRVLMRSHAKVLALMADQWDELLVRRQVPDDGAMEGRQFRDLYRTLATLQQDDVEEQERKAA